MKALVRVGGLVALWCGCVAAQTAHSVDDPVDRARLLAERALDDNAAYAVLQELVEVAPRRVSGSPDLERAVAWARARMEKIGLHEVRLQEVAVPHWERGVEKLVVLGPGEPTPIAVTALGGSVPTPADGVEGELVVVRSFEQLHDLGTQAAGKVVLFNRPMPKALLNTFRAYSDAVPQRTNGAVEAGKVGAVAALVRSMTTRSDDHPHTGALRYDPAVPQVPSAAVSTLGADRLAALCEAGPPPRVRLVLGCRMLPDAMSANVIGEIPGRDLADEVVLLGAHLDSWDLGQGAHDDGAGCAHVLEAMRLLVATHCTPRRTIRAVLFTNEENGLRGGQAYAAAAKEAKQRHVAAIETDSGGFEPKGFTCDADEKHRTALAPLLEPLRVYDMGALVAGGGGADISGLAGPDTVLLGLAVANQRYFDVHHSALDVVSAVNDRELALGAAAIAYLAQALAE